MGSPPLDASYFTDNDQLTQMLQDERSTDNRRVSSVEDANGVIEEFRSRDSSSPWTALDRATVADRLSEVVSNPRSIQQGGLNLCGPATFMCMWCGRDPLAFAQYATELFENGSSAVGTLQVSPSSDLLTQDYATMATQMGLSVSPQADWMFLGALRNCSDVFWQGTWTGDPAQKLSALTRPEELADWLLATGIYKSVDNQANWATLKGIPHATGIRMSAGTDVALLIHLNLINAADNKPRDTDWLMTQFPNHFVMLVGEVMDRVDEPAVELSMWTWGETKLALRVPRQDFVDNYYGAVIAQLKEVDQP